VGLDAFLRRERLASQFISQILINSVRHIHLGLCPRPPPPREALRRAAVALRAEAGRLGGSRGPRARRARFADPDIGLTAGYKTSHRRISSHRPIHDHAELNYTCIRLACSWYQLCDQVGCGLEGTWPEVH